MLEFIALIATVIGTLYARLQYINERDNNSDGKDFAKFLKNNDGIWNIISRPSQNGSLLFSAYEIFSLYRAWKNFKFDINNRVHSYSIVYSIIISELSDSIDRFDIHSERSQLDRLINIEDRNSEYQFFNNFDTLVTYATSHKMRRATKPKKFSHKIKINIPVAYLTEICIFYALKEKGYIDCEIDISTSSVFELISNDNFGADIIVGADASIDPAFDKKGMFYIPIGIFGSLTNRVISPIMEDNSLNESLDGNYTTIFGEKSSSFHYSKKLKDIYGRSSVHINDSINFDELVFFLKNCEGNEKISVWSPFWKLTTLFGYSKIVPTYLDQTRYINSVTAVKYNFEKRFGPRAIDDLLDNISYGWRLLENKKYRAELVAKVMEDIELENALFAAVGLPASRVIAR